MLADQYQADTVLRTWSVGRDLQLKVLDEPALAHLLPGPRDAAIIGIVINHYAALFELSRLNALTATSWESFLRDMRSFFRRDDLKMKEIWKDLQAHHNDTFVEFVNDEMFGICTDMAKNEVTKNEEKTNECK